MNLLDALRHDEPRGARFHGVAVGIVTNIQDPKNLGRVKLRFPWLSANDESDWARIAAPMAGDGRGLFLLPSVNDEVLVAFEHGDPRFPYVLGALWNGRDKPPAGNGDGVSVLKSRSGHIVRLDDTSGSERIEIIDQSGNSKITIDSASNTITLSAANGKLRLEGMTIEIEAQGGSVSIKGTTVDLN